MIHFDNLYTVNDTESTNHNIVSDMHDVNLYFTCAIFLVTALDSKQ